MLVALYMTAYRALNNAVKQYVFRVDEALVVYIFQNTLATRIDGRGEFNLMCLS